MKLFFLRIFSLFLIFSLSFAALPVMALQSEVKTTAQSKASLVTLEDSLQAPLHPSEKLSLHTGLSLLLEPQFHTYWRNPGDAGEAPEIQVTVERPLKNDGFEKIGEAGKVASWETPTRFSEAGLMTFGYENEVFFPVDVPVSLPLNFNGRLKVTLEGKWLACAKLCVPQKAVLTVFVPVAKETVIGAQKDLFEKAQTLSPQTAPFEAILEKGSHLRLKGQAQGKKQAPSNTKEAYFYPYAPGLLNGNVPQIIQHNGADLILDLVADKTAPKDGNLSHYAKGGYLDGVIEMTRNNGQRIYYELRPKLFNISAQPVRLPQAAVAAQESDSGAHVVFVAVKLLLLAFIGGILLNLMPCVFPVLAMKAFSLAKLSSKERPEAVSSAICYTLGTVWAFLSLGILVLALRHAGHLIGWGFQFQSPVFVALVCWLLLLMALNLAGVFEIIPPAAVGRYRTAAGHVGDFVTGVLAVVVASPCTAPFMGVALAGALASSGIFALGIFTSLALGLAFPYLLLACWPALGRFLPKPGGWMEVFKQFLAFPLLAACVWLIWVVSREGGVDFSALVLAGGVLLAIACWILGISQKTLPKSPKSLFPVVAKSIAFFAAGLSLLLLYLFAPNLKKEVHAPAQKTQSAPLAQADAGIVPFHLETLKALRAKGEPVLIDMSAAWCITCIMNEKTTLNTEAGQNVLKKAGAVLMQGDWTNKDSEISRFLHLYHREGVPLYVWFPKNWPADKPGILLPQILTPAVLRHHLLPEG